jgi:hypothetical protein
VADANAPTWLPSNGTTTLPFPDAAELAGLPALYVPRSYAGAGAPFWTLQRHGFRPDVFGKVAAIFAGASVAKQGAAPFAPELGAYALGLAIATSAIATGVGKLPAVPDQWREVSEARRIGGTDAQIPRDRASVIISPWSAGTPAYGTGPTGGLLWGGDAHRARTLKQARIGLAALAHGRVYSKTQTLGVSYLMDVSDLSITFPESVVKVANLPAILFTVAVVGAVGLSQYFKADVEKTRLYLENETAVPLAGIAAAVQLELARIKEEAVTGKKIEPSPLASKVADALDKRIATLPQGPGQMLRTIGGIAGGVAIGLGAGFLAKKYWPKQA